MTLEQAQAYEQASDKLKLDFVNTTEIILHEPLMRTHRQDFSFGGEEDRQRRFCESVDRLVGDAEFVAFAVAMRKWELVVGVDSVDPYLASGAYELALQMLFERYVDYLHHDDTDCRGRVTVEAQGRAKMPSTNGHLWNCSWTARNGYLTARSGATSKQV